MKNSLKCIAQIVLYMILYNFIYIILFFVYLIIADLIAKFPLLGFISGLSYAGCGAIISIGAIGVCNLVDIIYRKLFKDGIFRFAAITIIIISVVEGVIILFNTFRLYGLSWDAVDISAYPVILSVGTTIVMFGLIQDAKNINDFNSPDKEKYQALSNIYLPPAPENYYHSYQSNTFYNSGHVDADFPNYTKSTSNEEAPRIRYCPNCGFDLTDDTIFCGNCGKKVF